MCVVELDRQKVISLCFPALVTDETRTNANLEAEMHLTCDPRTLELFLSEKEQKTSSENVAEQEMTKEEQKRQMEIDFQNELKEIMEAEKVSHSKIPSVGLLIELIMKQQGSQAVQIIVEIHDLIPWNAFD